MSLGKATTKLQRKAEKVQNPTESIQDSRHPAIIVETTLEEKTMNKAEEATTTIGVAELGCRSKNEIA